jgi:hypothetical protein
MNDLDQNIPSEDISDPPVTTDLLIRGTRPVHRSKPRKMNITNVEEFDPPDPKRHQYVSFLKSFVRIVGCVFGGFGMFVPAFISFGIAEVIGIVEEMV